MELRSPAEQGEFGRIGYCGRRRCGPRLRFRGRRGDRRRCAQPEAGRAPHRSARSPRRAAGGYGPELAASLEPTDVLDRTLDAVVAAPGRRCRARRDRPRQSGAADDAGRGHDRGRGRAHAAPDAEPPRPAGARGRLPLPARRRRAPRRSSLAPALTVALRADGETIGSLAAISRSSPTGFSGRRPPTRSRASPAAPARRSGTRCASSRRASRPSSTRSRPPQPPRLLRVPRPRDRPRPPLRALRLADRVRPRRLQADQRPDRPPRGRRRARSRSPIASAASSGRRTSPAASAATSSR